MDFKCTTNNCQFHFKTGCTAAIVDINAKGVCNTKCKRVGGAYAQTLEEFEMADELAPLVERDANVQCDAIDCVHNENMRCKTDDVLVSDALFKTKCFSYRKQ